MSAPAVPEAPANPYFRLPLPYVAGCDVRDIGSINHSFARTVGGRARMFAFLEAHARRVTGIDVSAAEVAQARVASLDLGRHPVLQVVLGLGNPEPYPI